MKEKENNNSATAGIHALKFVYVHRLRKGINRESHALKVARLAGLPEEAIQVAGQLLIDGLSLQGNNGGTQRDTKSENIAKPERTAGMMAEVVG